MSVSRRLEDPVRRARGRPKSFNDKGEQNTIKALDRGLHVLKALAGMEETNLTVLSSTLGEPPATIYRILSTLQKHEMVECDEAQQTWHIGPGAFLVGSAFLRRTSLIERSRPVMRRLMAATGETANLGIERDDSVLFISQVETHASIRAFFPPGTKSPLHASGIGKALLAFAPGEMLDRVMRGELEHFTQHTITEPQALHSQLQRIRECGYAVDNEERTEGMRCVAAPIRNAYGEVIAGISVSGPTARLNARTIDQALHHVLNAGREISALLGAPEPDSKPRR